MNPNRLPLQPLVIRLSRSPGIRRAARLLRLHVLANAWLHVFPVVREVAATGVKYRVRRVECFALAADMMGAEPLYSLAGVGRVETFADVGCNAGYFGCWLAGQPGTAYRLRGLAVDANADVVADAAWHAKNNTRLSGVEAVHGMVGTGRDGHGIFYEHASSVCSTAAPLPLGSSGWMARRVPCVSVEREWRRAVGDVPCDLLKLDIEGYELEFFRAEPAFMRRTRAVVMEWHKHRASLGQVESVLASYGFVLHGVLREDDGFGTATFVRRAHKEAA